MKNKILTSIFLGCLSSVAVIQSMPAGWTVNPRPIGYWEKQYPYEYELWDDHVPDLWSHSGLISYLGYSFTKTGLPDFPNSQYFMYVRFGGYTEWGLDWTTGTESNPPVAPDRVYIRLKNEAEIGFGPIVYETVTGSFLLDDGYGQVFSGGIGDPNADPMAVAGDRVYALDYTGQGEIVLTGNSIKAEVYGLYPDLTNISAEISQLLEVVPYQSIGYMHGTLPGTFNVNNFHRDPEGNPEQNLREFDQDLTIDVGVDHVFGGFELFQKLWFRQEHNPYSNPLHVWTFTGGYDSLDVNHLIGDFSIGDVHFRITDPLTDVLNKTTSVLLIADNEDRTSDADVKSKLNIRWHYPLEDWEIINGPVNTYEQVAAVNVTGGAPASLNGAITVDWTTKGGYNALLAGEVVTILSEFTGLISNLYWSTLARVLGVSASTWTQTQSDMPLIFTSGLFYQTNPNQPSTRLSTHYPPLVNGAPPPGLTIEDYRLHDGFLWNEFDTTRQKGAEYSGIQGYTGDVTKIVSVRQSGAAWGGAFIDDSGSGGGGGSNPGL